MTYDAEIDPRPTDANAIINVHTHIVEKMTLETCRQRVTVKTMPHGSQEIHDTVSDNDAYNPSPGPQHIKRHALPKLEKDQGENGHIVHELQGNDRHIGVSSMRSFRSIYTCVCICIHSKHIHTGRGEKQAALN